MHTKLTFYVNQRFYLISRDLLYSFNEAWDFHVRKKHIEWHQNKHLREGRVKEKQKQLAEKTKENYARFNLATILFMVYS